VLQTDLPGVVIGIRDIHSETIVLAEVRPQEVARAVHAHAASEPGRTRRGERIGRRRGPRRQGVNVLLTERPAVAKATGIYCAKVIDGLTQPPVAWVRIILRNQPMSLRAYIREGQNGAFRQLAFDCQVVMLSVRKPVVSVVTGRIGKRCVNRIVQGCICRAARRWESERESALRRITTWRL